MCRKAQVCRRTKYFAGASSCFLYTGSHEPPIRSLQLSCSCHLLPSKPEGFCVRQGSRLGTKPPRHILKPSKHAVKTKVEKPHMVPPYSQCHCGTEVHPPHPAKLRLRSAVNSLPRGRTPLLVPPGAASATPRAFGRVRTLFDASGRPWC